jgi:hypothetical protein
MRPPEIVLQIGPTCTPQVMSTEDINAAPNGGSRAHWSRGQ